MSDAIFLLGVGGAVAIWLGLRSLSTARVRERLTVQPADELGSDSASARTASPWERVAGVHGWLARAGFRSPRAEPLFYASMWVAATISGLLFWAFDAADVLPSARAWAADAPSMLAVVGVPLVAAAPWLAMLLLLAAPYAYVRARRAARVDEIEEDLPSVLELLAAMARAGLGFGAGTERLIESESSDRALIHEFALLQRDGLAGVPRAEALRRMAERIDVPTMSTFCSALIHAESAGIGLAEMLRQQADDLRGRRRERALLKAQSLPVKLVFPLVICFLPGLFVFTLGPAFATFFQLADQIIEGNR